MNNKLAYESPAAEVVYIIAQQPVLSMSNEDLIWDDDDL